MEAYSSSLSSSSSMEENQSCKDLCGKLAMRVVYDHKVRGGIALTVFVLSVIVALALVPGIMGTVGSFSSAVPVFTQIAQAVGLPGVIALDAVGGGALLVAIGTMVWAILEFCKSQNHYMNEGEAEKKLEHKIHYSEARVIKTANNGYSVTYRTHPKRAEGGLQPDTTLTTQTFTTKDDASAYADAYRSLTPTNKKFFETSCRAQTGLPNKEEVQAWLTSSCAASKYSQVQYGIICAKHERNGAPIGTSGCIIETVSYQYYFFKKGAGGSFEIWPSDSNQDAREALATLIACL